MNAEASSLGMLEREMQTDEIVESKDREIVTVKPDSAVMTRQGLPYFMGISAESAGTLGISMHIVTIPPGGAALPHLHRGFETAIYVLEGKIETRYGRGLNKSGVHGPGEFLFIPPGVPHHPRNLSLTETAKAIVARNDPSEQENVVPYNPAEDA